MELLSIHDSSKTGSQVDTVVIADGLKKFGRFGRDSFGF